MWVTLDGHTLRLPDSGLASITSQLRKPVLWDQVNRNFRGSLPAAVARTVADLATNAHRIGCLRSRVTGRGYPVFKVELRGVPFRIIAKPVTEAVGQIFLIRPDATAEFGEAPKSGTATVTWTPMLTLEKASKAGRGKVGMYVIYEKVGPMKFKPLTNGIAGAGSGGRDLTSRIREEANLAARWGVDLSRIRVKFAFMTKSLYDRKRGEMVEHATRREFDKYLQKRKQPALGGDRPKGTMDVPKGKFVAITHRGRVPTFIKKRLDKRGRVHYGPGSHESLFELFL